MNIYEIAKCAGVSPATVSRVLTGTAPVKAETRLRVLQVVQEQHYIPNLAAKNLSAQNVSDNIGLFVPDMDNPFFGAITKCVTQIADRYRYNVFLFNTDEMPEREHRFLQTVKEQNLKGIIMIPLSGEDRETERYLLEIEQAHVPVVLIDRRIGNSVFDSVFTDDEEDSYRAVQALVRAGHRKIATIAGPQRSSPGFSRLQGYRRALAANGIEVPPEYIRIGNFKFQMAYEQTNQLLELEERPTAIFTSNNFSTLGALQSISEHGLGIGKDISILGFDEIERWQWYPWVLHSGTELSLVERPVKQMAEEAMGLLQDRITGAIKSSHARRKMVLSNNIVLRGSERFRDSK